MLPGMPVQNAVADGWLPWIELVSGDAGGAVGRLAILSARLDVGCEPFDQHVHADRDGNRRGVSVQPGGDGFPARFFPRPSARWTERRRLYFEAAAAIMTLVLLGQVLELRARSRTGAAIRALLDLVAENGPRS